MVYYVYDLNRLVWGFVKLVFFVVILGTVLIDQLSKALVRSLMDRGESIAVLPPVFYLTYIHNAGAAFGLLSERVPLFVAVAVLVVGAILAGYRRISREQLLIRLGLGLIAGGAIGNLIDRLRFGSVVDFLDFRVWPVFNLADSAIVMGAFLLIWEMWQSGKRGRDVEDGQIRGRS